MEGEALPLADESASRLVVASALARLRGPYRLDLAFDSAAAVCDESAGFAFVPAAVTAALEHLWAPREDPFTTAGALDALLFARAHGVACVDANAVSQGIGFMTQALANPGRFKRCNDALCKAQLRFEALWTLSEAGHRRTDFLSDIVAQSSSLDSATQIRLARYLLKTPGWQGQGAGGWRTACSKRCTSRGATPSRNLATCVELAGLARGCASRRCSSFSSERRAPAEQIDGAVRALVATAVQSAAGRRPPTRRLR